ncbi:MAG: hypothetical protein IPP61_00245 [Cytophagaceae bacterium]|nr:hypothetical protein [Cytophagaceae bacterium]MBL0323609.1 hypothetical protein [Cytophagaceae bacterium]
MTGLSVIIRNKNQFNKVKEFLSDEVLYLDFVPKMAEIETSIVIIPNLDYSLGSVGSSDYQKQSGLRLIEFSDFFKE